MSVGDILIVALLAVWLIASILAQVRNTARLRSYWHDFGGLLPGYKFFAPKPITADYQILYRFIGAGDVAGEWISLLEPGKPVYCCLWNPKQRLTKAISDLVGVLYRYRDDNWSNVQTSGAYLLIVNHITSMARSAGMPVQFIITQSNGFEDTTDYIILGSYVHPHSD